MAFLRAYRKYSQRWRYYPFTHNGVHVFLRPAEGVRFRPCIDGRAAKLVFISKEHGEGRWLSVFHVHSFSKVLSSPQFSSCWLWTPYRNLFKVRHWVLLLVIRTIHAHDIRTISSSTRANWYCANFCCAEWHQMRGCACFSFQTHL